MGKNIGKNINKILSGKDSKKFLDLTKQSATETVKTKSKIVIKKKTVEATDDLIGNKITDKIIKVLTNSRQNDSESSYK